MRAAEFVASLDQTRYTLIYLADPTTGTRGIHHHVVTALGGRPAHGTATLAAQAAGLLAAEHNERGRVPVLVCDESHMLTHGQLEAVRILTNSDMDAASPLACLLIGQPTLRRMLRLGVLAALATSGPPCATCGTCIRAEDHFLRKLENAQYSYAGLAGTLGLHHQKHHG